MSPCIISCDVFRDALAHIRLPHPETSLTYLPSHLHLRPRELKRRLVDRVRAARHRHRKVYCLYGVCFPDIDHVLARTGVSRCPGGHCFEMLLGRRQYQRITRDCAGVYFVERGLIENFEDYCVQPLELGDPAMRDWYFEHYKKIVYIRQPSDMNLSGPAQDIADFLSLELVVMDADYGDLERNMNRLMLKTPVRGGGKDEKAAEKKGQFHR